MPIPYARRMNLIALALLITAVISLVAFHFLPTISGVEVDRRGYDPNDFEGWTIWEEIGNFAKAPNIGDFQEMIGVSTFLTGVVLILSSPILIPALRRSRLVWWIATLGSGLVLTGLGGLLVINNLEPALQPGPAIYCLLTSLALNFLGLLCIRRDPAPDLP